MVSGSAKGPEKKDKTDDADAEPVAERVAPLRPAREVGWIFKNGKVVAIERRECESRTNEEAR